MKELFLPLPRHICEDLQDFPYILRKTFPMNHKHWQQLPAAIEELSTRLTSERSLIKQPYWSAPRLTAAYMWYFLPWNILRLTRLLHGLDLPPPTPMPIKKDGEPKPRIFVDMGSGPLSLPLALWFAKPEWRHIPLTVLCTDIASQPLQFGQKIFESLAGEDSPWRILPRRCHLEGTGTEIYKTEGVPWLITAANVCNELKSRPGQSIEERLADLVETLAHGLTAPAAHVLFVDPGTRLGGKPIVSLSAAAHVPSLWPTSPCPHPEQECPLYNSSSWCHFTFDTVGAPTWLRELSAAAHLRKEALSLAFVLLQKERTPPVYKPQARIISAPFRVPSVQGFARYACCAEGLALLQRAEHLVSGALVEIKSPHEDSRIDKKSGAFILDHTERTPTPNHAPYSYKNTEHFTPKKSNNNALSKKSEQPIKDEKKSHKKNIKPSKKNTKKFWEK